MTPTLNFMNVEIYTNPYFEIWAAEINGESFTADYLTDLKEVIQAEVEAPKKKGCSCDH